MTRDQAYGLVLRLVVDDLKGSMKWHPGGRGGGGTWELQLRGKTATIPCHDDTVNALDVLYQPRVPEPQTWEDYDRNAPLLIDAFWRLVRSDIWK